MQAFSMNLRNFCGSFRSNAKVCGGNRSLGPKSGFPHTPFRESHKRNWKKLFDLLPFFLEKLSHGLGAHFPTKICIEPNLKRKSGRKRHRSLPRSDQPLFHAAVFPIFPHDFQGPRHCFRNGHAHGGGVFQNTQPFAGHEPKASRPGDGGHFDSG